MEEKDLKSELQALKKKIQKTVTFKKIVLLLIACTILYLLIIFIQNRDVAVEAFKAGWNG